MAKSFSNLLTGNVPLHDGSRHWVVLNEGEKFLAATMQ
jgi:hypothetical protein